VRKSFKNWSFKDKNQIDIEQKFRKKIYQTQVFIILVTENDLHLAQIFVNREKKRTRRLDLVRSKKPKLLINNE
jgi:hypothetical protein